MTTDFSQDHKDEKNQMQSADLDALLNQYFKGRVVRKDLTKQLKEGANGPAIVTGKQIGRAHV